MAPPSTIQSHTDKYLQEQRSTYRETQVHTEKHLLRELCMLTEALSATLIHRNTCRNGKTQKTQDPSPLCGH
jgi:hypothetical protein